ncbi:MAG: oxygen-independent coproporphyrinogen III oxidase [Verrucomicrobiota bacterium]|nr:oxygen-independent coproporphyrinogen III oxidase [Verrucomicrobiota bacterium]
MNDAVVPVLNESLLVKYAKSGPRYTSYPTAPQFHEGFTEDSFIAEVQRTNAAQHQAPVSLYFHLPFCKSVCFFCGCNVTFTSDRKRPAPYIQLLLQEMDLVLRHMKPGRKVVQLHWGGGTPTFFAPPELAQLFGEIRARFELDKNAEVGVEIDPRETTAAHLKTLSTCGFNRLSMGVQDFDAQVQEAVNRIQPESLTRSTIKEARDLGFTSINVDLIYGLPYQTPETFERTIHTIIDLSPDRIALFNFAYLPEMIRHQKAIKSDALPSSQAKMTILNHAILTLTSAGYRYIGMDHFAKPTDEMCVAQDNAQLYRNFQGYSTHAGCDLYAFGVSSISQVGNTYSQNYKNIHDYEKAVSAGHIPVQRGISLSADDLIRREVIMTLLCSFMVDKAAFEKSSGIAFDEYFVDAQREINELIADGLLIEKGSVLEVTPVGRLLVRNIAMAFDTYLKKNAEAKFSRTV